MMTAMIGDYSDEGRDPLTGKIIAACYQAHNELGPNNHHLSLRAKRSNLILDCHVATLLAMTIHTHEEVLGCIYT
jgi:hypothetical protein